jgi:hypothetical protein
MIIPANILKAYGHSLVPLPVSRQEQFTATSIYRKKVIYRCLHISCMEEDEALAAIYISKLVDLARGPQNHSEH